MLDDGVEAEVVLVAYFLLYWVIWTFRSASKDRRLRRSLVERRESSKGGKF